LGVLMRGPPAALAAGSSSTPSQAASRQTRSRMTVEFSPMPPGNTIAARPGGGGARGAELATVSIAVETDGEPCSRIARREQRAHVARDTRHAEQSRLVVEQVLHRARIHSTVINEVQNHTRIE